MPVLFSSNVAASGSSSERFDFTRRFRGQLRCFAATEGDEAQAGGSAKRDEDEEADDVTEEEVGMGNSALLPSSVFLRLWCVSHVFAE